MSQWSQETRAKSLISRSSVVTQALMQNESKVGLEAYDKLQSLESQAVAAGATYEIAKAALGASQTRRDEAERDLSALNSACLVVCKVRGVTASLFEEFDRGDPIGLATHLEAHVGRIDTIGPMLTEMLRHQRRVLAKHSAAVEPEARNTARTFEALSSTLFHLEAGIASARALLATRGVLVKFPTKGRTSKKPVTSEATRPAQPNPEAGPGHSAPSNGATTAAQPAADVLVGGDLSPS